ncbi:C6 transcription factor [Macrophomina phaseolina MS6]|uniref:C6 transcription factor n=1 Tax=Macrophomina phaseolina (strain MS6) TaxID=1126212 RepID=K2RZ57_MACPH|nr:C6 transcription factor [Macrophomina phaseolina MS6]
MDGILALASLHIALEDPEKRKPFTAHALSYHNRGLKAFSDALPSIDPDNCDALFAFGIITTLLTLALCDSRISAVSRTPFDNIVFISKLLKGIGTVVSGHRQWLHSGKFQGLLAKVDTPSSVAPDETCGEAIASARQHIFHYIAGMDESERSVYTAAVGMLDAYSGTESAGLDIGALVAFPLLMDERIVAHLCENRYPALQVLLYYGLLMSQLEDRWWARMFGRQLISDVKVFIDTFHSGYDPAL